MKVYNDRRLYSPGPEIKGPLTRNRLPIRICLVSAAVLMFALLGFIMYTGTAVLYVHFWVYTAVVCAVVLLLLGAGAFAIYNKMGSERARRIAAIILIGVMLMFGTFGYTICQVMTLQKPAGFFDSPKGENRIVVMLAQTDNGVVVSAYPAIGNHFYVAAIESEHILSNGVVSGVEWEGERLAKVLMEDIDGNDVELVVDFSPLYSGEGGATAE